MGIEKLSAAARAAGFAMATSDDLLTSPTHKTPVQSNPWQSAEVNQSTATVSGNAMTDLRRSVYSLFGWSAAV